MEQPVYSKIYPTGQRDYRYNYTTQKLQRIEKRILKNLVKNGSFQKQILSGKKAKREPLI
ncbi:hypothetical protein [Anaerotruncus sp. 1XD42-93]|uniref:hypothetical protein n=1 Tax=Anaerotruncus sp. 1XD42-93 TaxID=2320853 RepID=UPI000EA2A06F|nr:hypothetical protein [Anaerotruncus sp. 1XD42-93]NBK20241.1 hypothetical protein [Anaerotruncus sp. 1XD42-93]RKJ73371.1 hypothetical protein D7Y41_35025 [Anaerotruncus sp. 1XD22-93]